MRCGSEATNNTCNVLAAAVVGRGQAQRVRLRVPGQRDRRAVPGADQPVHRRRGQPGAAHRPVVRPHGRLPHVRRAVEPQPGGVHGGRHAHPGVRERHAAPRPRPRPPPARRRGGGGQRHQHHHHHAGCCPGAVPRAAADGRVQLHLERGRLGDAGRAREDGLVARAVRGHVPGGARGRVRLGGQRHGRRRRGGAPVQRVLVGQGGPLLVEGEGDVGAERAPEPPARVGARAPPRLRLLRRHRPLPRAAARVRRPLSS
ncbi:hypothetical protein ZEAMMB73_Zm00001d002193 [Zea mays]|uniref:Uncharacterized protein n=1 Tax=Zea mays TaxID=4577 RepID=A0A1D6DXL0_MAIZE|nr:hypothetical protein ZEAMMB73_Zm00001d002193 [Zea mays]